MACKNADRIFLGTNQRATICDGQAMFTFEDILSHYSLPKDSNPLQIANLNAYDMKELDSLKEISTSLDILKRGTENLNVIIPSMLCSRPVNFVDIIVTLYTIMVQTLLCVLVHTVIKAALLSITLWNHNIWFKRSNRIL